MALSQQRREAASRLASGVEQELHDLLMDGARFGVAFRWRESADGVPVPEGVHHLMVEATSSGIAPAADSAPTTSAVQRVAYDTSGFDEVEFLVSPNPGEPLKSMAKIASGGETSRLMLALKTVLSRADRTPTLIFDEIDQGIGGRVGATVGQKLWELTRSADATDLGRQVLCVTHLPQLAAFGDTHFHVEKAAAGQRTVTRIRVLEGETQVSELAAMLGAAGEAAYRNAEEILEHVRQHKQRMIADGHTGGNRPSG